MSRLIEDESIPDLGSYNRWKSTVDAETILISMSVDARGRSRPDRETLVAALCRTDDDCARDAELVCCFADWGDDSVIRVDCLNPITGDWKLARKFEPVQAATIDSWKNARVTGDRAGKRGEL